MRLLKLANTKRYVETNLLRNRLVLTALFFHTPNKVANLGLFYEKWSVNTKIFDFFVVNQSNQ